MAPLSRLDLGPNLRTRLGPEYFRNLLGLEQVMPAELRPRGIDDAEAVCSAIARAVKAFKPVGGEPSGVSPEDVFRRLARS